ncbi:MAG: hypothetical protein NZ903_01300 [Candidatus Micrarchaeota archaeon]|nr:hypothetical protein [Candidatus Micrarchaeota archaeon]
MFSNTQKEKDKIIFQVNVKKVEEKLSKEELKKLREIVEQTGLSKETIFGIIFYNNATLQCRERLEKINPAYAEIFKIISEPLAGNSSYQIIKEEYFSLVSKIRDPSNASEIQPISII